VIGNLVDARNYKRIGRARSAVLIARSAGGRIAGAAGNAIATHRRTGCRSGGLIVVHHVRRGRARSIAVRGGARNLNFFSNMSAELIVSTLKLVDHARVAIGQRKVARRG